jgi:hypothetical protein
MVAFLINILFYHKMRRATEIEPPVELGEEYQNELLQDVILRQPLAEVIQICNRNPVCSGDFWLRKARRDFPYDWRLDSYPFPPAANYYNYLAAGVRSLVRPLVQEMRQMTPVVNYDQRINEITNVSEIIARYMNYVFANHFHVQELHEFIPAERRFNIFHMTPYNYARPRENLIIILAPDGRRSVEFGTDMFNPPLAEKYLYPSGSIDRWPPLFQEFLRRCGLTYGVANLLYNYNIAGVPDKGNWI